MLLVVVINGGVGDMDLVDEFDVCCWYFVVVPVDVVVVVEV